ncbi:MAG: hypothetical protein KJ048_11405 [Dehalococcoidia bacterium]|nr:hypothetical protein [Dehalococcoidia bacterium]
MNQWVERIRTSQLKATSEAIEALVDQLTESGLSEESCDLANRQAAVARHVRTRVYGADPRLVPTSALKTLETGLEQVRVALAAFQSSLDPSNLGAADNASEALLNDLRLIPVTRRSGTEADASSAFLSTVASLEARIQSARESLEAAATRISAEIQTAAADARSQLDSLLSTAEARVSEVTSDAATVREELANAQVAFEQGLTAQKTRVDTFIQNGQTQLTELQSRISGEALTQREEHSKEFTEEAENQRSTWEATFKELADGVGRHLEFFRDQETVAQRILGKIAASQTAGTYLEESSQQQKEANRWRWLSFFIWIGAIVIAVWSAHEVTSSVSDVSGSRLVAISAARLAVAGVALSFAFWVSAQSGHHRKREQEARTIASELTTLRPFLAELPDDELRKSLGAAFDRYFPGKHEQSDAK